MIKKWEKRLTNGQVVLPFRGTSTGWRNRPTGNRLKKRFAEKNLGVPVDKMNMNQQWAVVARIVNSIVGCFR